MEEKVYIRDLVNKAWGEIDKESLKVFLDQIVKKDKKLNDILPLLEGISHSKTNNNLSSFSSLLLYLLYQEVIEIEEIKPIIDSITLTYDVSEGVISDIIDFFTTILMVESAQIIHFNNTMNDSDKSHTEELKLLGNVRGSRKKVFIRNNLIPVNMFNGRVNHGGYVDLERSLTRALQDMNKYLDNDQDSYTDDTKARTPLDNLYNITARNLIRLDGGNNEDYESQFRDIISFLLNSGKKNRYIIDKLIILNYGDMARYSRLLFKEDIEQGNPINPINVMDDIITKIEDTDEEQLIEVIKDIYERYLFNMEINPDTGEIAEYAPDEPTETKLIEIEDFLKNNDEKNNELLRLLKYIKNRIID